MKSRIALRASLTMLAFGMGLVACTVTPAEVSVVPPSVVVTAPMGPPPPRAEVIAEPPGPDFFWVYGHWAWGGREYRWEGGHWERHREHAHWVPHHWDQDEHGRWRLHEGFWHRD